MPKDFRMYMTGQVHFTDARVTQPISFAHISDLHLPPYRKEAWPARFADAIGWWDTEFEHPNAVLPGLLDQAQEAGVDFVFFGGDNLDVYDAATADRMVELCHERGLGCYFSFGNHDFETYDIRYITHDHVPEVRRENGDKLMKHWSMPNRYYTFEINQVRFVVLDAPYIIVEGGLAGFYDAEQVDWLEAQLKYDGPIVVFYHIPFMVPGNRDRLLLTWNGVKGWAAEDENSARVLAAIDGCPNVLGTFAGHTHTRSEEKIGEKWQFVVAGGSQNAWRYVRICDTPAPKSLRNQGRPTVEGDGGPSIVES